MGPSRPAGEPLSDDAEAHEGPAMQAVSHLRVMCPDWMVNRKLVFEVLVDGASYGSLRRGGQLDLDLEAGQHVVAATTRDLGRVDLDVEVSPNSSVDLACAANREGLTQAATRQWGVEPEGPPPFDLWVLDDGVLPEEPYMSAGEFWVRSVAIQATAMGRSPQLVWRLFKRTVLDHALVFALAGTIWFGWLFYGDVTEAHPSVVWTLLAAVLVVAGILSTVLQLALWWLGRKYDVRSRRHPKRATSTL